MTKKTGEAHNPLGQPVIQVPISEVPILSPGPGQQGYWMVPLPPAPGALPGQPIQWAPVLAYGRATDSQQASVPLPPPSAANPEWTALSGEKPIPIDDPVPSPPVEGKVMEGGSAPDSAAGDKEQAPAGLPHGMDWFVVPIPAPPGSEGNMPSDGPSALILLGGDDGGPTTGVVKSERGISGGWIDG
ncbi:hypothetical protein B9Z19DRAFT_1062197 [Tuber borchii]|uniref:Uncharacterized protein n=1 Tax=Tuber borchii TaxID=42251 RepID=A0A2T7A2I9_TUBBO|nr:hypothetical protein B9Z19DRAFT_1062197 [Tuber borchii]